MRTWLAVVLMLGMVGVAWGDLAPRPGVPIPRPPVPVVPPGPAKPVSSAYPLEINLDNSAAEARILIPITAFRRAELNPDPNEQRAETPRLPTIMTGLCLALALAFAGLWMVRHRGLMSSNPLAILFAAMTFVAISGAVVWANGGVPRVSGFPVPPVRADAGDRIVLEVVNNNDNVVRLVVSKKHLEKVLDEIKRTEAKPQK